MALTTSSLEEKIKTNLSAAGFDLSQSPMTVKLANAIAKAVVEEIKSNAQVTGVQPGAGTATIV